MSVKENILKKNAGARLFGVRRRICANKGWEEELRKTFAMGYRQAWRYDREEHERRCLSKYFGEHRERGAQKALAEHLGVSSSMITGVRQGDVSLGEEAYALLQVHVEGVEKPRTKKARIMDVEIVTISRFTKAHFSDHEFRFTLNRTLYSVLAFLDPEEWENAIYHPDNGKRLHQLATELWPGIEQRLQLQRDEENADSQITTIDDLVAVAVEWLALFSEARSAMVAGGV